MAYCSAVSLLFFIYLLLTDFGDAGAEISIQELEEEAAEIANRTYVEEQNALQTVILRDYNKRARPVAKQDNGMVVRIYPYISHLSIDQKQQILTLSGQLHMKWYDEQAVWEPNDHNGAKTTYVRQWDIWSPNPGVCQHSSKIAGVGEYFQIERYAYAKLTSVDRSRTEAYLYSRFSIGLGCNFDYSNYPYDVQKCYLCLETKYKKTELEMIHGDFSTELRSAVGWKNASEKQLISEWSIKSIRSFEAYHVGWAGFKLKEDVDREALEGVTIDPKDTHSMLVTEIIVQRYAPYYGLAVFLPALISFLMVIFSFFLQSPATAVYILIANLFLLGIYIEDLLSMMPPAIGGMPRIVYFFGANLTLTMVSIFLQLWFMYQMHAEGDVVGVVKHAFDARVYLVRLYLSKVRPGDVEAGITEGRWADSSWPSGIDAVRNFCVVLYLLIMFIYIIYLIA